MYTPGKRYVLKVTGDKYFYIGQDINNDPVQRNHYFVHSSVPFSDSIDQKIVGLNT